MIKAIFFDFNGVIIDDETIQMKAYQEVLNGHEIALTEELYFGALGMDDRTFVRSMFEHAKKPLSDPLLEEVLDAKTDLHREMIEELPLFPGVLTFLKAASREFQLGLVSMANLVEVSYVFQRANLTPLFSVIVTAEDASVCKPAPDCYLAGLRKLNEKRQHERDAAAACVGMFRDRRLAAGDTISARGGYADFGVTNTVSDAGVA